MTGVEIVAALVIAVGLVGVVLPLLPGSLLVFAAVVVWASETGGTTAWTVAVIATLLLLAGAVVKYVVPGRRLRDAGVPTSTLVVGGVLGVVGFFVVPVIGLPLGFVLGVYLAEVRRLGHEAGWPATRRAVGAVGLAILVELAFGMLAALTWAVGVVLT